MGFRKEPTHYKLSFEDPQLQGFEVTAKSLPLRDFLTIAKLGRSKDADKQGEGSEMMFRKFGDALVEWNLEDEKGKKIPATYDGLMSQEMDFVNSIVEAWMQAVANIPNPSPGSLNGGVTSQELTLPMEVR